MTTIDLNQTAAQCLHSTDNLGSTIIHNICTGADTTIPWGSADWGMCALATLFVVGVAACFFAIAVAIFFNR